MQNTEAAALVQNPTDFNDHPTPLWHHNDADILFDLELLVTWIIAHAFIQKSH